jgi:hypothetical protein
MQRILKICDFCKKEAPAKLVTEYADSKPFFPIEIYIYGMSKNRYGYGRAHLEVCSKECAINLIEERDDVLEFLSEVK